MQHMPPPPPPAHPGYYRDVDGALRWWDGQQWTGVAKGEPQPQQSPPPQQPAKKPDKAKIILLSIGGVIVGLVFLGSCINLLSGTDDPTAAPAPTVTVTETVTEKADAEPTKATPKPEPEPESKVATTIGEGNYEVGVDVQAGRYKTKVAEGDLCYWARNKDDSGDSIIANELQDGPAQMSVTIKKGEFFETSGCGTWTKVG